MVGFPLLFRGVHISWVQSGREKIQQRTGRVGRWRSIEIFILPGATKPGMTLGAAYFVGI